MKRSQCTTLALIFALFSLSAVTQAAEIMVTRVTGPLPTNPLAAIWQHVPATDVVVSPQQITKPKLDKASVSKITAQALSNGQVITWRLSWKDATPDFNVDVGRFSDAVALELPLTQYAAPMMGHRGGGKVQIIYWRALWQKDIDEGFQDVQDVYPNYFNGHYWFATGEGPYRVPESFTDPISHQWFIAKQAGNPMSTFFRTDPAQELIAEGWGTLTHQPESATTAKGVWKNGQWTVIFTRPLVTTDPNDYQFTQGEKGQIAFAVWQGGDNNVGGRKHWSSWMAYKMQ
ncbi:MAG: hypothetical protein KAH77_10445 [Thiomargarita sp.]|nr:hypothetical protein [Thiomargarita sp.]